MLVGMSRRLIAEGRERRRRILGVVEGPGSFGRAEPSLQCPCLVQRRDDAAEQLERARLEEQNPIAKLRTSAKHIPKNAGKPGGINGLTELFFVQAVTMASCGRSPALYQAAGASSPAARSN